MQAELRKDEDILCAFGSEVKAQEGGKVEGYLVKFTSENDPDLAGDFFAPDTEFGTHRTSPTFYHHGMDRKIGTRVIGEGALKIDDIGVWIEAQLNMRDEYEKAIWELAKKGKLGWSSGTANHLVKRQKVGKAFKILSWPLGLDASLTPQPAEYRNVVGVKSLMTLDFDLPEAGAEVREDAPAAQVTTETTIQETKDTVMEQKDIDLAVEAALKARAEAEAKAKAEEAEVQAKIDAAVKAALADKKPVNAPALNLKAPKGDDAFKAMSHWIRTGDNGGLRADPQYKSLYPEDLEVKTSYPLVGGSQYQGAEVVPIEVLDKIYEKRDELSIARRAGAEVRAVDTRTVYVPIDINAPAWTVQTNETTAFTEPQSTPLDKVTITIQTYNRTVQIANALIEDSVADINSWWMSFLARGLAVTENAEMIAGDGSGNCLGVHVVTTGHTAGLTAASATTLTGAEIVSLYYKLPDQYRDNCAWTMSGATEGIIRGLSEDNFNFINTPSGSVGGYLVAPNARVFNSSSCPAATASLIPIVVGNWSAGYLICEARQMKVFRDPYSRALYDQVCLHASARFGGGVKDVLAFRGLTMASA